MEQQQQQQQTFYDMMRTIFWSDRAWGAIAAGLRGSVPEFKKLWQQLRYRYRQIQTRVDAASRNGENPRYRPKWFAYEAMAFLRSSSSGAMLQRDGQSPQKHSEW
uniref:MADF domain-containing protein n=1 Tax=Anopheles coluzzii TaxID=1518534 RepID=A0A8W7PDW3_ANOCL